MDIDDRLHQLAIVAKQHPQGSRERQTVLSQIYQILNQPNLLKRRSGMTEDAYQEARQVLLLYICEKIDNYDPIKGCSFLRWVNSNFVWRQKDEEYRRNSRDTVSLDFLLERNDGTRHRWEEKLSRSETLSISEELRAFIEEDPDGIFTQTHVKNKPKVTLKMLLLKDFYGLKFKDISEKFDVPIPTLSSFLQRRLMEIMPYIKEYFLTQ